MNRNATIKTKPALGFRLSIAIAAILALSPAVLAAPVSGGSNSSSKAAPSQATKQSPPAARSTAGPQAPHKEATGLVEGKITNAETNEGIKGAVVTLSRAHKHFRTETAADGSFSLPNVPTGDWQATASKESMLAGSQKLHIDADGTSRLDLALDPAEAADVMRVTGKRTLIHPEKIGSTTHLNRDFLQKYGSGNDLRQDIQSTPGVLPDSLGNIIVRGEHNSINYELDGAVLPEAAGVLQQGQFASPRSLQSLDVDIGGYDAKDGGGPLGAVVRMRSLPIQEKPVFKIGEQLGGPMSGGLNYYASTALSLKPDSIWNKVRVESSGLFFGGKLGVQPPTRNFRRDARFDINVLNKIEFKPTDRDTLRLTAGINESFLHLPTSPLSRQVGYKQNEHDRQNFIMLTYRHAFAKWLDEANLHVINAFYSQKLTTTNVFNPEPIINGDGLLVSASPTAKRFNYALSIQGNVTKTIKAHHFLGGFLTEFRPVKTSLSSWYYNADPRASIQSGINQINAIGAATAAVTNGLPQNIDAAAAQAAASNPYLPIGALISPFTMQRNGPQFGIGNNIGQYRGFRYLQSAYLQDTYKPTEGKYLKRLTLDLGVRVDVDHGVFGNSMGIAQTIAAIPGMQPFSLMPFVKHKLTDTQVSGRYGAAYVLAKNTVLRGSYSDIFNPAPVDIFVTPFAVTQGPNPLNGIFNGAPRPLRASHGKLVDVSIEQQVGPRLAIRTNLFYKQLRNFGDSGVVNNTLVYNRLTLSGQQAQGVETRIDLKPARDGCGFSGFLAQTTSVAYLRGTKKNTGGVWDVTTRPATTNYPDHDRRVVIQTGLQYKAHNNLWILGTLSCATGVKNDLDPNIYGSHGARVKPYYIFGLNMGWDVPERIRRERRYMPFAVELRIENLANSVVPVNLGSPYQGTRYSIPIRVLSGLYWKV